MLATPTRYDVVAGAAEGITPLTAFDRALLVAGIGNLNLLKVSSILPPQAVFTPGLSIPPGSLVPTAYAQIMSETPGDLIAAAVAVGRCSEDSYGVIMECSGHLSRAELREKISGMVREAFTTRGLPLATLQVKAIEHRVVRVGCAMAAVSLWY